MKEKVLAGNEADAGVYRCNACANEYEHQVDGQKLPLCNVCDSASWSIRSLAKGKEEKKSN
ncbi:MAG: hypothetical protein AB9866_26525 [Syntrophobacteraceae bacterium]